MALPRAVTDISERSVRWLGGVPHLKIHPALFVGGVEYQLSSLQKTFSACGA